MPYDERSAEAEAGRRGERAADEWLRVHLGYSRIMVSMLGSKAVFIDEHGRAHAAYDRLYFTPRLGMRWCDIKWKTAPIVFQKLDVARHGIDLPAWQHYVLLATKSRTGGDIAIIEVKRHRVATEIAPMLLIQSVAVLAKRIGSTVDYPTEGFPFGAVFWDADLFENLGRIGIGNMPLPPTRSNLHPWEARDRYGELRLAPRRVRTPDLFEESGWSINGS
jgi:hypothetical protein